MIKRQNTKILHGIGFVLSLIGIGCDSASDHPANKTKVAHRGKSISETRIAGDELPYADMPRLMLRMSELLGQDQERLRQQLENWKTLPPEKAGPVLLTLARLGRGDLAMEMIREWDIERKEQAITLIFSSLTGNPADQWELAASLNTRQSKLAQSQLLKKGAQEDPAAWCDLAWQHREQLAESTSWQTCLTAWSEKDPAAFGAWLNDHSLPQQLHDETVRLLVMRTDSENRSAETAVAWAETVSDPQLRLSTLEHALRELCREKNYGPEEAISACSHLSESEKSTLLDQLSQSRRPGFSPPD